jgi:class 3 adenylate cyclase
VPKAPQIRYVDSGGHSIAYTVLGEGPPDIVFVHGIASNLELDWSDPASGPYFRRLASFARVLKFDKRGTGLSDRVTPDRLPTLEERIDDVRAVMDAAGVERATLFGFSEGAQMSVLFAATYPDRVERLVLHGSQAHRRSSLQDEVEIMRNVWGRGFVLLTAASSLQGDEEAIQALATYERQSATPAAAVALREMVGAIDVTTVLPVIRQPTLVLHSVDDLMVPFADGRAVADGIPGARFVQLPGGDHLPWVGPAVRQSLDEIEEFVTGTRPSAPVDRVLTTVLFTDIVDSTKRAASEGDAAWRTLLDTHDTVTRQRIEAHHGRAVKSTGDGFLATFDGPARAVRCAHDIASGLRRNGLEIRAGVHTGECELRGDDIGGIAVHLAARVAAKAGPGEVWVSRTVRDLTAGSGLTFEDRGSHELKGVPQPWDLYVAVL